MELYCVTKLERIYFIDIHTDIYQYDSEIVILATEALGHVFLYFQIGWVTGS